MSLGPNELTHALFPGDGGVSVEWERVGQPLPRSTFIDGRVMTIERVNPDDGGTYRCVASNAVGVVYAQVVLIVEGKLG